MLINELPPSSACVSDLTLDQLEADELSGERARAVQAHLAGCRRCSTRRARMAADARAFLATTESAATERRLHQLQGPRASPARRLRRTGGWITAAALAAATVLLMPRAPSDVTRTKGAGLVLSFFVKRGESVIRGADGMHVRAGDRLRFTVRTARAGHLTVLSIDGAGVVSTYYPASEPSVRIDATASERALDASVELDATPGEETIAALICDTPADVESARREIQTSHSLVDQRNCRTAVIRVVKESPRP